MTQEEYFDNCVWLADQLHRLSEHLPKAHYFLKRYENEALKLYPELYDCEETPNLQTLLDAWSYRQYCPMAYDLVSGKIRHDALEGSAEVLKNGTAATIFRKYHTSKNIRENGEKVLFLERAEVEKELEILEALQDLLIDDYAKKGIVIEANPSSNVFIGTMDAYRYHPLFRFTPPDSDMLRSGRRFNRFGLRSGRIRTCVNSDDPAIFATTLQNEFQTIKRTAITDFELSEKEADTWCEELRLEGIEIFKESMNHG